MNTGSLFGFVKTTILGSGSRCWKATIYFFLSVVSDNDIFVPKREGLDDIVLLSPLCIELTLDFLLCDVGESVLFITCVIKRSRYNGARCSLTRVLVR